MSPATDRIVLYTSKTCPWAQRARLALIYSGAKFEDVDIDLQNKPDWYKPGNAINPASKVPAILYGAAPDESVEYPNPSTFRLPESALVVSFVADLFPNIDYETPFARAKASLLALQYEALIHKSWNAYAQGKGTLDEFLQAVEKFQPYITEEFTGDNKFGVGEVLIAPLLGRFYINAKHDLGLWPEGDGPKVLEVIKSPKYTQFHAFVSRIVSWDIYKKSFDEAYLIEKSKERIAKQKAELSSSN